jgi:hypothetical protein
MSISNHDASEFVQVVREFLAAHAEMSALLEASGSSTDELCFDAVRALVGDDDHSVLYRLKERSHKLFRADGPGETESVRREALFDLAVGSLFHEAMKLRESLYQREVYAPRVAALRAAAEDHEAEDLFLEFERILDRSVGRIREVVAEVRILLAQTRDQLRLLLIERAGERIVTRFLLSRRAQVDATFPEGFEGLLQATHGATVTGLVEASRSLLESAYFVEATRTLREAARYEGAPRNEIDHLALYAEGMQAFLDEDYAASLVALEAWVDLGAHEIERDFARLAASALSRLGRLVDEETGGEAIAAQAKELQLRLETVSA